MEADTYIKPFVDIPSAPLPQNDPYTMYGGQYFPNANEMQIGFGAQVFRADQQGIWLGAATFGTAPFSVSMSGALIASSATLTGSITATSGVIGGFTIGTTTITGNGSGGDLLTAATGERIEIRSSTKRINLINGSGHTVMTLHCGTTYNTALFVISPQDDDRGFLSLTTLSGNTQIVFDIASQGTGQTFSIRQSNTSNTHPAMQISCSGSGNALYLDTDHSSSLNHTAYLLGRPDVSSFTNASVLFVELASSAVGNGIYISDPTSNTVTMPLRIVRSGNVAGNLYGAKIAVTNSGGNGVAFDLSASAFAFNFAADTTAAGAYKGRIPVTIAGVTKYLHYFDA